MADESSLSRQIASVDRSVVFLRQEHLTLLHGLHLEILSLQKRCSGEGHTGSCSYRVTSKFTFRKAHSDLFSHHLLIIKTYSMHITYTKGELRDSPQIFIF